MKITGKKLSLKEALEDLPGEETEMVMGQLERIHDLASELGDLIAGQEDLPAWVQSKIAQAVQSIADVYGYIEPKLGSHEECCSHCGCTEEESEPSETDEDDFVEEGKKKGLWANIHARRKAGKRPLRPGEKGYPKTLDIEESLKDVVREYVLLERDCVGTKSAPVGSPRQRSFCRRMCGHMKKNTSAETASDPNSCIRQSLRRWKCRCR